MIADAEPTPTQDAFLNELAWHELALGTLE